MQPDFMKRLSAFAELEDSCFSAADLGDHTSLMNKSGLLRELSFGEIVMCDACEEGHSEKVVREEYPDGKSRFYIFCPYGGGRVEVAPDRLRRWTIAYNKFAEIIASELKCGGGISEVVSGRLWNLGNSMIPLDGVRRPVCFARKLCGSGSGNLISQLPEGRSPLLFHIGAIPVKGIEGFDEKRIFNLSDVLLWENSVFTLDIDMIQEQLKGIAKFIPPKKKAEAKRTKRALTADKLLYELKQHLIGARNHAYSTREKTGQAELLSRPTMAFWAEKVGVNKATVSRILKDKAFLQVKLLWESCLNIERVMQSKEKF